MMILIYYMVRYSLPKVYKKFNFMIEIYCFKGGYYLTIFEMVGIGALLLNTITLAIVFYQTKLSKKGFQLSKTSFDTDKKIREMSIVPKMYFVLHVQLKIEEWIYNIQKLKEEMEIALKDNNENALENIANKGLKTCKGLVNKFYYEKNPDWLSEIYIAGAKYYYYVFAPISGLWDEKNKKGRMNLLNWDGDSLIARCDESEAHLKKLLEYINDFVPEVFKEVPDSISDYKFLSDD